MGRPPRIQIADGIYHLTQRGNNGALLYCDEHLHATIEYVLANPAKAGLCPRLDDWPWSYDSGTSQTTPSGGSVTGAENGWSCHGTASDSTPPRLPTSEPP